MLLAPFSSLLVVNTLTVNRLALAFPDFEKDGANDATAIAFSPDGSTLYIATDDYKVYATSSSGDSSPEWSTTASDSNICDMAVSPDGLSVSVTLKSAFGRWRDREVFITT